MPQYKENWKQNAIKKSGGISDAWDVFISYAGRFAAWILFGCMISNIVEVVAPIPAALVSIIMVVQVITLDIAGFGLNTIAKQVSKKGDAEGKRVARKANRLATFLIALMVLTLALVTTGYLMPSLATIADEVNKGLILVRVIMIVLYMHTMHELSEAATDIAEKEEKTEQANDKVALSNQKKIETMSALLETVHTAYTEQQKEIHLLRAEIQTLKDRIHHDVQNIDSGIDTRINQLASSVTEIHNNVLQITQNNQYSLPLYTAQTRPYTPLARDEQAGYSVEEVGDSRALATINASPAIPLLELPGTPQERIHDVLTIVLSGASWSAAGKQLGLNYSRHIMPIREAYEHYQASLVSTT